MKIVYQYYDDDKRTWRERTISEIKAKEILSCWYRDVDELLKVESIYPFPYGEIRTVITDTNKK